MPSYITGADLPDLTIAWLDGDGDLIDFATGWTFTARIGKPGRDVVVEKTEGITGADTDPNVTITWEPGELDELDPGAWRLELTATRDGDGKQRKMPMTLVVRASFVEGS